MFDDLTSKLADGNNERPMLHELRAIFVVSKHNENGT